ncbi:hypothetical protein V1264_010662 [Littorina saxatilis]|uniref:Tetraspanin n=2 Tax=Littorina saxatilis TaxID=31220 RepID=A0AAN9AQ13_9CAEN
MFGLGMAGFVVGLIAVTNKGKLAGVESQMDFGGIFEKVASILIPIGLVFITLGLLGAAGVATQNPQLLLYYAMIMGGLLVIEALAAVSVFANSSKIEKDISEELIETMKTEYDGKQNSTKFFSVALDFAQYFFGCCGIEGLGDFKGSSWYNRVNKDFIATPLTNHTTTTTQSYKTTTTTNKNTTTKPEPERIHDFPISCCKSRYVSILTSLNSLDSVKLENPDCYSQDASDRNLHTLEPCVQAVKDFLYSQVLTLLSLTFTFVGLEMSAASNAYSMSKEIIEKLEEERQENEDAEAEEEEEAEGDTRI